MTTTLNIRRAARLGALGELFLQLIIERRVGDEAIVDDADLELLQKAAGMPQRDMHFEALCLIGEEGIDGMREEGAGLRFFFAPAVAGPLPRPFAQTVRQHGIRLADAEAIYRVFGAEINFDEESFLSFCLKEVGRRPGALLPRHWQPGPIAIQGLRKRGATDSFIAELVPEFILIFNEQPKVITSHEIEFFRFASARWRRYVNAFDESTDLRPLPERWQPSAQVQRELLSRGVTVDELEYRLPEFRLYAREHIGISRNWGLELIKYLERRR